MPQQQVFTSDRDDKDNLSIQFSPPVHYTPAEVEAGNKLVEVVNDPSLSEGEKKDAVWDILNNV
ncbi:MULTISPECIES: hypothetical protein [unclassified Tolypothrix]|uniref:hypothetical protein n=1 Tax=unclassified Tolypothrix TaxID=2649714 RepID=UPI0005EABD52|nr:MULTISPECIES: hypothetical protein [unclassified Tolypothrix]BAY90775.1 hypothetical protein NIES3275_27920 [Microchaete diplosiphon NIES-3275]EKF04382.1 hypothetical protein FDUTEX481_02061 [Tolypothrix sp. PCC 7601]MBE9081026.1 hypothetical protein [Tolypothrix sp. LEGE 11397]UYD24908.1 hypothetical protein HGR01_26345 [Tolypothrix sp. PCC 7712]UYD32859.1 hypothetical protein HG267_28290 [Tolypothrix sp. PCC 7601]